jgi:hypothetical protein
MYNVQINNKLPEGYVLVGVANHCIDGKYTFITFRFEACRVALLRETECLMCEGCCYDVDGVDKCAFYVEHPYPSYAEYE